MAIRSAVRSSPVLTGGVLLAAVWILLSAVQTYNSILWGPGFVGTNGTAGLVGLGVMLVLLSLLMALYGELGASDPSPDTFPPEE